MCLVCAGAYGVGRIAELRSQVNGLSQQIAQIQGDMNHSIGNIRSEIQESLEQQASIVADWNFSYGDYDHKTKTVELFARATPKPGWRDRPPSSFFLLDNETLAVDGQWKDEAFGADPTAHG